MFLIEGVLGYGSMVMVLQFLFIGNFLAYTPMALVLYFVTPLAWLRPVICALSSSRAAASIFSYFGANVRDPWAT